MAEIAAVLTGDLIGSTRAPAGAVDRALATLARGAAGAPWARTGRGLTRHRGDGWQVLVDNPRCALRLALVLQAALRAGDGALPSRIAVGIGAVTARGTRDLSDADGPAFHRAGAALEAMKRGQRLAVAPEGAPPGWCAAAPLLDALVRRWSRPQAEALAAMLAPDAPTQADLARQSGITPQSLSDRLNAAGFPDIERALDALEDQAMWADTAESGHEA